MRVVIAPVGRPADVYPYFALGKALEQRGHDVLFCAPEMYRSKIMNVGFRLVTIGAAFDKHLQGHAGSLPEALGAEIAAQFVSMRDALREADLLISSMLNLSAPSMAVQFGVRHVTCVDSPMLFSDSDFQFFGVPAEKLSGIRGAIVKKRLANEWNGRVLTAINRERKYSGMKITRSLFEYSFRSGQVAYALSPQIFSVPQGATATGFLFYDEMQEPSDELREFLSKGEPPVYVDACHTTAEDQTKIGRQVCSDLATAGKRCVVSNGWGVDQSDLPDGCLVAEGVLPEHAKHFSAVVHEGRSDWGANAARFGIPQMCAPRRPEHVLWADALKRAGVATVGDVIELSSAIRPALQLSGKAKEVAERISSETGAATLADLMEANSAP